MFLSKQLLMGGLVALALLASGAGARAAAILGGSTLLDGSAAGRLEAWLGQGPITLTNIFTKTTGSTSRDFHAAADGRGPTFSVMQATNYTGTTTAIIGGYNPQSWNSSGAFNLTIPAEQRTSFIFNLTSGVRRDQDADGFGEYQTYNDVEAGPSFGFGYDIWVDSSLEFGVSTGFAFGNAEGVSILDGQLSFAMYSIAGLEVFAISLGTPTSVPEPLALSLFAVGLAGLALATRRRRTARAG